MNIVPIRAFTDNYIWVIIPERSKGVLCIDPGDSQPVIEFLNTMGLELTAILLTHHHPDHIGGVADLLTHFPKLPVYGPNDPRIPLVTHPVQGGDTFELASLHFDVLATSGHTSSHISLYETTQGWLFCGDTLFSAGCGRVFDGTIEALHQSIQCLKALPPETQVYCAHEYTQQNLRFAQTVEPHNTHIQDYLNRLNQNVIPCTLPSTIAMERLINPFMRTDIAAVEEYVLSNSGSTADSLSIFKKLREAKNNFPG